MIEVANCFWSLSPKLECLSYPAFNSLIKFDKMIRFILPFSLPNKKHFKILSINLVNIFKRHPDSFINLITFYPVNILPIHIKIPSSNIKIFSRHNIHTFNHFESSCERLFLIFIISITFIPFIEVTQSFVKLYCIILLFPVYSTW